MCKYIEKLDNNIDVSYNSFLIYVCVKIILFIDPFIL